MFYELTDHFIVAADLAKTWEFFSAAGNLPAITPPWLNFTIRTPEPIVLKQDAQLDYTIHWMGLPIRWRTRIIDWSPPRQFIDLQIRGPYALWHHQHRFTPTDSGTDCTDRVIYRVPGPVINRLLHATIIRRQLLGIFRFRRKVIEEKLGMIATVQQDVTIKIVA